MRRALLVASLLCIPSLLFNPRPLVLSQQAGGEGFLTTPEAITAFADSLFHRGILFGAAMEYERFLYLYPAHPGTPKALFNLATAAKLAGDRQSALTRYTEFLSRYPLHDLAGEAKSALLEVKQQN